MGYVTQAVDEYWERFTRKEKSKNMKKIILVLLVMLILLGCSTVYTSLRNEREGEQGAYELLVADEQVILDAAYDAIWNTFPNTAISSLTGKERGFTFYTQPLLDRTVFKLVIERVSGLTEEGKNVVGYYYSIYSHGTQFWVESRYVGPLRAEFKKTLTGRGVTFVRAHSIKIGLSSATEKPIPSTPITPSSVATKIATVTWTSANIRSGAGDEFPVLTIVNRGERLTIIGEREEWFNVRLEDGKEGWIKSIAVK
jgi:uncharacterized protein YceK